MTATPDWLREVRSEFGVGFDAIALFRGTDPHAVSEAIADCEVLTLASGTALLRPGDANDTIFVLLSGELAAFLDSAKLPDAAIPIHSGESVGEMSAIDGRPVSALVVALSEARVLVVPSTVFWDRLNPILGISRNLLAMLSLRMRQANKAMLEAERKRLALEYLRQELQIARQLQTSMIPCRGRLFPERDDVEIAGVMEPATEIGGDFFDAFFVDAHRLFFCVGDVSGHGIPAALLMARTLALIRTAAIGTRKPHKLVERINDQLCAGNETNVFVTLLCGFLDVVSGELEYANAGHCAPLIVGGDGVSPLPLPKGALVGVIPGARYRSSAALLHEQTTLICYTDGVIEAESEAGMVFTEAQLAAVGAASCRCSVVGILDAIQVALTSFTGDRERADDCTLLAIRRPART
jgi:sigma-B regulation protein RsbU (phosphoserine phosphatase)